MSANKQEKATFAEVFGSMKFRGESTRAHSHPWPTPGFASGKSSHGATNSRGDDHKLVRSSN